MNMYTKQLPRILRNLHCKYTITTNSTLFNNTNPSIYWCRLQSTDSATTKNEIVVYSGPLTTQLRGVKIFSLMTSISGIVAQPILYKQLSEVGNVPLMLVVWSFFGFFTIGTPLLLHLLARKYITTLMYKPDTDTYVATTLNLLNFRKDLEFKTEDVKVPEVLGMFTSFTVNNTPFFVDPRFFSNPKHYGKIMGYDKPLDFKLSQASVTEAKK